MSENISRRSFLAGAGVAAGIATVPGLVALSSPAVAAGAPADLPYPYEILDPVAVGRRAYEIYWASYCAEGAFYSIAEALAAKQPTGPWAALPKNMFRYGAGGVAGWGTICGALNGAMAAIAMAGAPGAISDALMVWYGETPIPSSLMNDAVAGGWTPTAPAIAPLAQPVKSTAGSQLCHISLSKWLVTSGSTVGSPGMADRCGKLTGDVAKKTVELLNAWKVDGTLPTVVLPPSVAACKTCHSTNAYAKQDCSTQCHTEKNVAHSTPGATLMSCGASAPSIAFGKTFILSGALTVGRMGDPCVVEVMKPGSSRWSYSSARLVYAITGQDGHWWYRYAPTMRGVYSFRAKYDGGIGRAACVSPIVAVRVK
jgi:hypothetical protein